MNNIDKQILHHEKEIAKLKEQKKKNNKEFVLKKLHQAYNYAKRNNITIQSFYVGIKIFTELEKFCDKICPLPIPYLYQERKYKGIKTYLGPTLKNDEILIAIEVKENSND